MRNTIHHDGLDLVQYGEQAQPRVISEDQVLGLPEPLQRYLRYAQVVGKAPIRTVRLTQAGSGRGAHPDQDCHHLAFPIGRLHLVSLQNYSDRIRPIRKGDCAVI